MCLKLNISYKNYKFPEIKQNIYPYIKMSIYFKTCLFLDVKKKRKKIN